MHLDNSCDEACRIHYSDAIMGTMASQTTTLMIVYSTLIHAQIKENIKAPRHWPLCGNPPVTGELPTEKTSNAKNVSIWWHHGHLLFFLGFVITFRKKQSQSMKHLLERIVAHWVQRRSKLTRPVHYSKYIIRIRKCTEDSISRNSVE